MINHVTLHGRFTDVPQLRKTNSGKSVCTFTLAVDRMKREDPADFINCVAWERTAEFVNNYFTRGQEAAIEGRLANRQYEDRDGNKHYATEVVAENFTVLGNRARNDEQQPTTDPYANILNADTEPIDGLPF